METEEVEEVNSHIFNPDIVWASDGKDWMTF